MAEAPTPGPWEVVPLSGSGGPYAIRMAYKSHGASPTYYGIREIHLRMDAQLVAAAPDMMAALRIIAASKIGWTDSPTKDDLADLLADIRVTAERVLARLDAA